MNMENMAYTYKRKQRQILNQHEQAQNLKMIITEPTKTGTELVFFFDLRILITSLVSSYASNVIVEKTKMTRFLHLRHQSKFSKCHNQKESSLRMVSAAPITWLPVTEYIVSQMTKNMFCFLSSICIDL